MTILSRQLPAANDRLHHHSIRTLQPGLSLQEGVRVVGLRPSAGIGASDIGKWRVTGSVKNKKKER